MAYELLCGDALFWLGELADASIDSVVTDPPYALTQDKKGGSGAASLNVNSPTALKPANEPIVLARKPLSEQTVAANVLRWGTGALRTGAVKKATCAGWQANAYGKESRPVGTPNIEYGDTGTAARFFYSAKAGKADRCGSKHPTGKPVALMRWLARLVTPHGGVILDPFAGSGTTGQAAREEGFGITMIEREAEYQADIRRRLDAAPDQAQESPSASPPCGFSDHRP